MGRLAFCEIYSFIYLSRKLNFAHEMLINYTLRSVNNIGVDQSVLMRRLVYAFIVRKSTTCKSGFLEKNSVRRNVLTID